MQALSLSKVVVGALRIVALLVSFFVLAIAASEIEEYGLATVTPDVSRLGLSASGAGIIAVLAWAVVRLLSPPRNQRSMVWAGQH
ncbi:MAG: hypothetical protein B7Y49_05235 [Sphingomonas sp. 28-62-11]|nr:MAG: hypothetical protein B7Y49_05235 [Sphingomonas sp. 28-62-11]